MTLNESASDTEERRQNATGIVYREIINSPDLKP